MYTIPQLIDLVVSRAVVFGLLMPEDDEAAAWKLYSPRLIKANEELENAKAELLEAIICARKEELL